MARTAIIWPALRARRVVGVAVAAAALVILLPAAPASAHAFLTDSNPADGAVYATAPSTLRLEFSESVVIAATRIDIVDSTGRHYEPRALRLVHSGSADSTEEPAQVVGDLPALPRSAYRVNWETLSSDDLHRTGGVLVFGVNEPVKASPFVEPTPRPEEAAVRWLIFLGLAAALGGQLGARLYRRRPAEFGQHAANRCRWISVGGAAMALVASAALLVDQLRSNWPTVGHLLTSSYGVRWDVRELGLLALLAGGLLRLGLARKRNVANLLVGAGAACACIGTALLGHAASGPGFAPTRTVADASHLAAAATWSGMLLVALLVVVPQLRVGGTSAAGARAVLRSFGVPAAWCVSVMVVTGVYLASGVVGSVDAALFTFYGRALLIKLAVVGLASGFALINMRRLHGRDPRPSLRRTVCAEALVAVAILGLAAVLTSGQPAREPQFVAQSTLAVVPVVDTQVADLQESLAIRPNQPGRNVVLVDVFDTRRPALAPVRRVLVTFVGLDGKTTPPVSAVRSTDGKWSVAANLDAPGRTRVRVDVQRAGLPDASHMYRWTVGGAPATARPATVSNRPLAGILETLALVCAALLAIAWAGFAWRHLSRHRRANRPDETELPGSSDSAKALIGAN
jgi:copper transport protein